MIAYIPLAVAGVVAGAGLWASKKKKIGPVLSGIVKALAIVIVIVGVLAYLVLSGVRFGS